MTKFVFVGDPNDNFSGPESVDVFGHTFPKGEAVEVDDKAAARLAHHTHFKTEADAAADEAAAEAAKPRKKGK